MIDEATFVREAEAMLPGLYRLSMSILRAQADAQDAVQQGMLRAWERRAQAREATLRGWMTRIVINECRNIQRRRMRVVPAERMPERAAPDPGEALFPLREAIEGMPEKLRTPLLMRCMEGYSEREIAVALGVPVTTVKSRIFRGKKWLREQFGRSEVTFE